MDVGDTANVTAKEDFEEGLQISIALILERSLPACPITLNW
jgi:hypothetical protein